MALIKCTECGKEISDKAVTCPHCGAPRINNTVYVSRPSNHLLAKSEKKEKSNYGNMRLGFGITNLAIGALIFTAVLSSTGGIRGNTLQMAGAWFLVVTGLITILGKNKKGAIITSIVFYSFTIMILLAIMNSISGFSILVIMNIIFLILTSISFSKDKSFK